MKWFYLAVAMLLFATTQPGHAGSVVIGGGGAAGGSTGAAAAAVASSFSPPAKNVKPPEKWLWNEEHHALVFAPEVNRALTEANEAEFRMRLFLHNRMLNLLQRGELPPDGHVRTSGGVPTREIVQKLTRKAKVLQEISQLTSRIASLKLLEVDLQVEKNYAEDGRRSSIDRQIARNRETQGDVEHSLRELRDELRLLDANLRVQGLL